jgi:hypothetical protein
MSLPSGARVNAIKDRLKQVVPPVFSGILSLPTFEGLASTPVLKPERS